MKIYVLIHGDYDEGYGEPSAAYRTKEDADKHAAERNTGLNPRKEQWEVFELELA